MELDEMKVIDLFNDDKINQIIIHERSFDAQIVARVFVLSILTSLLWFEISRTKNQKSILLKLLLVRWNFHTSQKLLNIPACSRFRSYTAL